MATLFVGNDNDVYLQGYILASTSKAVTDARPSFTVYYNIGPESSPLQGPAISGLTGVTMSFVTATNGDYRGLIPGTANLTVGSLYFIIVTFANYSDTFSGWFEAISRTGG